MKWSAITFMGLAAEIAGRFLSLFWGFTVLVIGVMWVAGQVLMASAKAQTTEQRVNGLIQPIATAQSTANSASSAASAAQSTANSAQSTANSAQSTANAAMPVSGGTFTGGVGGPSFHASGVVQADGGFNVGGSLVISSGRAISNVASIHTSGAGQFDGGATFNAMNGASLPRSAVSASDGTLSSTASAVNGLRSRLEDVGIIP